ncbi:MAG: 5-formyltetrahydrofolate cyclo-ligase [Clostridia bacterium]|nr:5-formyltetrahydrofolate cyclo-ligase [Clostridia bacterium]
MCGITKESLRREFLAIRQALPPEVHRALSYQMAENVLALVAEKSIGTVMLYAAFRDEPETELLARRLLALGKSVALPKCRKDGRMDAFFISVWESLVPGAFGILEPPTEKMLSREEPMLILVPGCAFGRDGTRLGYGGGFYDRFLPDCSNAIKAGYCFSECLTEGLPQEAFDVRMDIIITDKGVVNKL